MQVNKIIKNIKNIKNIKKIKKTWIGICIVLIIFLGSLWWHHKNTLITENFVETGSDTGSVSEDPDVNDENSKTSRFLKFIGGQSDDGYSFGGITKGLDAAIYALTIKEKKKPRWNDLEYDDGELTNNYNLYTSRDISNLELEVINDNCSSRSVLKSDYKDDICEKYIGDYSTINEKCRGLNEKSCASVNCCVLLNGNKCVAGNKNGPTFYTDKGTDITIKYYEHRGIRYPDINEADGYTNKCGSYSNNSTGVSRECMVQLFNEAGCSNSNPDKIITDEYVENNIKSTKRYIKNDLIKKVIQLKILPEDEIIKKDKLIMCNGPVNECDNFYSYDTSISSDCMSDKFEQERLAQLKTYYDLSSNISVSDASLNEIDTFITDDNVELMKKTNKIGVFKWIADRVKEAIAELSPESSCKNYRETDTNISRACMKEMFKVAGCTTPNPEDYIYHNGWGGSFENRYKDYTKQQIQTLITNDARRFQRDSSNNVMNSDETIKCYGPNNHICDSYYSNSSSISNDCMQEMFEDIRDKEIIKFNNNTTNIKKNRILTIESIPTFIDEANVWANSFKNLGKWSVYYRIQDNINNMIKQFSN